MNRTFYSYKALLVCRITLLTRALLNISIIMQQGWEATVSALEAPTKVYIQLGRGVTPK